MIKVVVENSLKSPCLLLFEKYLEMKQIFVTAEKKCMPIEGRHMSRNCRFK